MADRFFFAIKIIMERRGVLMSSVPAKIESGQIQWQDSRHYRRFVIPFFKSIFTDTVVHAGVLRTA